MTPLLLLLATTVNTVPQSSMQPQERTVFQTGRTYSDRINLRADVAIVYGFDSGMPARVKAWRDRGYKVHLMTGVAWGEYADYVYGKWDGISHLDEAQTRKDGETIGHGKDIYYMSPGIKYGTYLAEGVRRALEVGVEAVHLEEPEFWVGGGYGEGFKREWQDYYHEAWQAPDSSPDARWRAAKLMYYLYRRALQQVFDSIQAYNKEKGTHVRCYVPTHSLINYASWGIVSPESSLARLNGCDGYIAQVWTGTARTPNYYKGIKKERTFETALMEYGSMQNLVRATGRGVWYLADPIEDDASHDWGDYRRNWQSTLTASLLQPEVWHYEVMPWPERIFNDKYPSEEDKKSRIGIPPAYETELQVVINALKDMEQKDVKWEGAKQGVGLIVSDSLMFQRGGPNSSDDEMGHFYGLAMPFIKRGVPIQPIQLENMEIPGYLKDVKTLLMTYEGMKPLSASVHQPIADWVKAGGKLVFVDNDNDPYNGVREWWNQDGNSFKSPREHLFKLLGLPSEAPTDSKVGKGKVIFLKRSPTAISRDPKGSDWLAGQLGFGEGSGYFLLRRGPYVIAAGLDETQTAVKTVTGNFVDLFDPKLQVQTSVSLTPESRHLLLDLDKENRTVIASAGQTIVIRDDKKTFVGTVEGISETPGLLLLRAPNRPANATLDGAAIKNCEYDESRHLLWLRFPNRAKPQRIIVTY